MNIKGIDISNWQQGIDLNKAKSEGYEYCIIKATQGTWYINPEMINRIMKPLRKDLKLDFITTMKVMELMKLNILQILSKIVVIN